MGIGYDARWSGRVSGGIGGEGGVDFGLETGVDGGVGYEEEESGVEEGGDRVGAREAGVSV